MDKLIKKASVLVEALPYIREFYGKTFVIKCGGSIIGSRQIMQNIMEDITLLKYVGVNPVIVHGGGPDINNMLKLVKKESVFVDGLRVTDRETMEFVEMILSGKINKEIVNSINRLNGQAVGISGKDGGLILAEKLVLNDPEIDLGYVGRIREINPEILYKLIDGGYLPVVAPVGSCSNGETYNINADTVAGRLAAALGAEKLIYLTDVNGIRSDPSREDSRVSSLTTHEVDDWIACGKIKGGMLPKVRGCIEAVNSGVSRTHILNGLLSHTILLEIFTDRGIGTMILKEGSDRDEEQSGN